ncbi:MAG: radical SAM protein [Candidatus Omnitrophica bacterium]|nr:radical SAM protein [Candidatus Omnitrophota bacterium]
MNVLILNPPVDNVKIVREGRCMQRQEAWGTSWAPLTLAIVASILRDAGFIVSVKDCSNDDISFAQLKHIIQDFKPDLVIANTSTPSISGDLKIADLTQGIDKHIKTVFFGIHVTALAEEIFKENPNVELIVDGEPEYTLRDLALALRDAHPISQVKGLIYRANGKIVRNEKRPLIENLDELPYPAWDMVNINRYRLPITNRPFLLVLTGRGCPNSCSFCVAAVFYGKKTRIRSWRKIVDEIKYVREKYNVNDFLFWAENGIINKQHMHELSQGLAAEAPGLKWVCNGRVDIIDEELLKTMKRAGCWMIGYGIEAGTQRVLDLMKKNIKIDATEKAIRLTKKVGIEVTAHVIVGYPGETKDDILNTLKLLKRLDPHYIQVYCCVPFPGSILYEELKKLGWLQSSDWSMFEQNLSVINTPDLSCQEVNALRRKIISAFYLNPRKILKMLIRVRSIQECVSLLSFAKGYFSSWVHSRNS